LALVALVALVQMAPRREVLLVVLVAQRYLLQGLLRGLIQELAEAAEVVEVAAVHQLVNLIFMAEAEAAVVEGILEEVAAVGVPPPALLLVIQAVLGQLREVELEVMVGFQRQLIMAVQGVV
jgi:hypothetical protein